MGLFPLRSGNNTVGLLQVNDHRKGIFTPARISLLEILGDNISIALDKFHAEENLKHSEEKYRLLSEQSGVGVGLYSKDGIILYYNNRALENLGGKSEDYIGKSLLDVFGKKDVFIFFIVTSRPSSIASIASRAKLFLILPGSSELSIAPAYFL